MSDHRAIRPSGFEPDDPNFAEPDVFQPSAILSRCIVPATHGFNQHVKTHERGWRRAGLFIIYQFTPCLVKKPWFPISGFAMLCAVGFLGALALTAVAVHYVGGV